MVKQARTNPLRPARRGPQWMSAVIMVVNVFQFVAIGMLGLVASMVAYLAMHGRVPEYDDITQSHASSWVGYMPVDLPWWYFALTSLVFLAVVIYAIPVSHRFFTTEPAFGAWRTTPRFLAGITLFAAAFEWVVLGFYDREPAFTSLFSIGPYIALLSAVLAFIVSRVLPHPTAAQLLVKSPVAATKERS